ncbi:MAG: hypothetical protein WC375_09200 [Methanomassiliicoccales archaeon]|jgi:hypothetical protein
MPSIKDYPDGIIELDSPLGKELGFTSDKFDGWLWKRGREISISMIISKEEGKGNFKALCERILAVGFAVLIPTPMGRMEGIVRKADYKMKTRPFDKEAGIMEPVEVWVKRPRHSSKGAA